MAVEKRPVQGRSDEDVFRQVRDAIAEQRLRPGTKLGEEPLAEIFDVSRRTMERVFCRLASQQLIQLKLNRGAFVTTPTVSEARDIFAARLVVEEAVTALVAATVQESGLARLRRNIEDEVRAHQAQEVRTAIHHSGEFHLILAELSGNSVYMDLVQQLVARTSLVVSLYANPTALRCWQDEHSELVDALAARDEEKACTLMRAHLERVATGLPLEEPSAQDLPLSEIFAPPKRGNRGRSAPTEAQRARSS